MSETMTRLLEEERTIPDHPIPKLIALGNSLGGDDEELIMRVVEAARNMQQEVESMHEAIQRWLFKAGWLEEKHPQIYKAMQRYGPSWRPK